MATKPAVGVSIRRPSGHFTNARTKAPASEALIASAEALLEFMSTGKDPRAACKDCGVRRDKHTIKDRCAQEGVAGYHEFGEP